MSYSQSKQAQPSQASKQGFVQSGFQAVKTQWHRAQQTAGQISSSITNLQSTQAPAQGHLNLKAK